MAKSKATARKSPPPSKRAGVPPKRAAKKAPIRVEVAERERVSGAFVKKATQKTVIDRRYFGAPRPGATHILLTKHSQNGAAERCFVNRNGVAEEKLPIAYASIEKLRALWGPGTYRGQWLALEHGKWKALGRTAEVRILPRTADESIARASSRAIGDVVATDEGAAEVPPSRALAVREPDELVDRRITAEREIAKLRLDAEREIAESRMNLRLEELRSENARALSRLEARIDSSRDDDDEEEPSPWAWIFPLLEKLRPTIEELVPKLLANVASKGA